MEESRFDGVHCNFSVQRLKPRVLIIRLSGIDIGEFGDAPMKELERRMGGDVPVHLFIDAREVRGASIHVSGEWARWLSAQKRRLDCISMLTGSKFIEVTAEFVRRFADLQGIMRIYTDEAIFDGALAEAVDAAG